MRIGVGDEMSKDQKVGNLMRTIVPKRDNGHSIYGWSVDGSNRRDREMVW